MYSTKGNPRRVTDEQVERILEWNANRKSLKQFAREINLPTSTITSVIQTGGKYKHPSPKKLARVQRILAWHNERKTMRRFAREMGLSTATVRFVIQIGGKYKQPSPEKRAAVLNLARSERKRLRAAGWL
jgi:transposase